jgi:hypothetical protein
LVNAASDLISVLAVSFFMSHTIVTLP